MTSENNRAPLLYFIKLCTSFQNHGCIQTGVTVQKRPIWVKIGVFCPRWPWKTIGHLFLTTSSFVHHCKAIGEYKLEWKSGNAQFGSKLAIFFFPCDFKLDGIPWKTIGHLFYAMLSFVKGIKNGCPCIVEIRGTQGCALVGDPARAVGECRDVAKAQP